MADAANPRSPFIDSAAFSNPGPIAWYGCRLGDPRSVELTTDATVAQTWLDEEWGVEPLFARPAERSDTLQR